MSWNCDLFEINSQEVKAKTETERDKKMLSDALRQMRKERKSSCSSSRKKTSLCKENCEMNILFVYFNSNGCNWAKLRSERTPHVILLSHSKRCTWEKNVRESGTKGWHAQFLIIAFGCLSDLSCIKSNVFSNFDLIFSDSRNVIARSTHILTNPES